jgi:hypothetical protein
MVRVCDSAHCGAADAEINEICKELGWPVNHPVLTRDANGPCTCSCSCLAFGTAIQDSPSTFKSIEEFAVGDKVMAAGLDLKTWSAETVVFSQGTTGASRQKYTVLITYADTWLATTSDHIFLMFDKSLRTADRLAVGDDLVGPDGKAVPILSVHIGDYTAGFHHIATAKQPPPKDLQGRLLNTNGVVTGDYSLQLYYRTGQLNAKLSAGFSALPIVGSPEYVAKHGPGSREAPSGAVVRKMQGLVAAYNSPDLKDRFISADATRLDIPPDACKFISDAEAAAKATDSMRAFNDPLSREWAESLIQYFRFFYPDVTYHLDWADNTVNAYAWVSNGVRHVALLGGLVRHASIGLEAIGLVLAHELAHHYGGAPTHGSGLSCEGQADYYGVLIVLRKVWFGEQYVTQSTDAISQMAKFFGVPDSDTAPGGNAGCTHPAGACRIATYHAAVNLSAKPGCAG